MVGTTADWTRYLGWVEEQGKLVEALLIRGEPQGRHFFRLTRDAVVLNGGCGATVLKDQDQDHHQQMGLHLEQDKGGGLYSAVNITIQRLIVENETKVHYKVHYK